MYQLQQNDPFNLHLSGVRRGKDGGTLLGNESPSMLFITVAGGREDASSSSSSVSFSPSIYAASHCQQLPESFQLAGLWLPGVLLLFMLVFVTAA